MAGEHARKKRGPRPWIIAVVCVVVLVVGVGGFVDDRPPEQSGRGHADHPPARSQRCLGDADRHQCGRWLHDHRPLLHGVGTRQPSADAQPPCRRGLGRALTVAPRVPGLGTSGTRCDRDHHRPRRQFGGHRRPRPAHGPEHDLAVHGRARFRVAPAAAAGRARLPAPHLHARFPADVTDPGGQRPGGLIQLALAQPAARARDVVDAGRQQRHHAGRGDELREPERAQDRRSGRPAGLDRSPRRRPERQGQHPALGLRPRQPVPPRDGNGVQGRQPRLQHAGQHRRTGGHHRERNLARLRPLHRDHHERHQSRRVPLRRPRDPVGELFPRW